MVRYWLVKNLVFLWFVGMVVFMGAKVAKIFQKYVVRCLNFHDLCENRRETVVRVRISVFFLILVDSFMSKNNVVKRVLWILEFNFFSVGTHESYVPTKRRSFDLARTRCSVSQTGGGCVWEWFSVI